MLIGTDDLGNVAVRGHSVNQDRERRLSTVFGAAVLSSTFREGRSLPSNHPTQTIELSVRSLPVDRWFLPPI